ncbi:hypothetical protein ACPPVQ_00785 [Diaminobutyricibacter sp. McL0618]|uniref:hypothetical protein n=1 Tax=Leifsonia sp. McL0618 TaxID=3415677 RepID=UPI003CF495A0
MATTAESLIFGGLILTLCIAAIILSRRLARWLQSSRGENPSAALHSRYRWGFVFGAIGGLLIVASVLPFQLDIVPGSTTLYIGIPLALIAFGAAWLKLGRERKPEV